MKENPSEVTTSGPGCPAKEPMKERVMPGSGEDTEPRDGGWIQAGVHLDFRGLEDYIILETLLKEEATESLISN